MGNIKRKCMDCGKEYTFNIDWDEIRKTCKKIFPIHIFTL